jgi:hypothetical protein
MALEPRLEDQFHAAANAAHLRSLHAAGDLNGLLEYALLLSEAEATGRTKVRWLIGEALARPPAVEAHHMEWAAQIMGEK